MSGNQSTRRPLDGFVRILGEPTATVADVEITPRHEEKNFPYFFATCSFISALEPEASGKSFIHS